MPEAILQPPSPPDGNSADGDVEAQAQKPPKKISAARSAGQFVVDRLGHELDTRHADLVFILCYFISGLCDSSVYRAWRCFVSMQTGNTVFLALGVSGELETNAYGWLRSLVSISSFVLGSYVFSNTRRVGPKLRRTLICSFCVQSILIVIAAALLQSGVIPDEMNTNDSEDPHVFLKLAPLALIAFQSSGQMAASRLLAFNEIPTTVLTSVYYDLVADPALFSALSSNPKRNRRGGGIISVFVGAVVGGWLATGTGGIATAFWIAAGLKMCIVFAWWFWKPNPGQKPPGQPQ